MTGWKRYAIGFFGVLAVSMGFLAWENVGDPLVSLYSKPLKPAAAKVVSEALSAKSLWFRFDATGQKILVRSSQRAYLQAYLTQHGNLGHPGETSGEDDETSSPELQGLARWVETQPGVQAATLKLSKSQGAKPQVKIRGHLSFLPGVKLTPELDNEIRKRLVQRIRDLKNSNIVISSAAPNATPSSTKS